MTDLGPGVVVARFRLDRLLGEGGMGSVWAATGVDTGEAVALKFVKRTPHDEEARRRLLREARAASAVQHPNVVVAREVIELDDGAPVLVMELLRGEPLSERLRREQVLPLGELCTILLPVVSAVGAAHAAGIVHRDLKPENVFLAEGEGDARTVKVL